MKQRHAVARRTVLSGTAALALTTFTRPTAANAEPAARLVRRPTLPPGSRWRLVRSASDDFKGRALDGSKWRTGLWYDTSGVGAFNPANVTVAEGNLVLTARKESYNGSDYTFGAVESTFDVPGAHTYVEVRAKVLDSRANVLSAIWMQSSPLSVQNNPNPEIDILETFSYTQIVSTLHRWILAETGDSHIVDGDKRFSFGVSDTSAGYHLYGLERRNGRLRLYADGQLAWDVIPPDPSYVDMPRHMVLSLEGHLGQPNDAYLPASFLIDYVHTYCAVP